MAVEGVSEVDTEFPPDFIEERIKANLEPILDQISAVTHVGKVDPRQLNGKVAGTGDFRPILCPQTIPKLPEPCRWHRWGPRYTRPRSS